MKLTLTFDTPTAARLHISGTLDFVFASELLDNASEVLAGHDRLRQLHLDLSDLDFCDSAGLSVLILVDRLTTERGVRLHLDNRPEQLNRILQVTGLFDHFTSVATADSPAASAEGTQDETVG
ncbi:STAS domain-containing protein [Mycolicibacterium sp. ELW1]|uniref:STAS domain-containing protein n=1 Tax=Mycobacteriaceae TaxID=1762 RepID=UPI0011ED5FEC|nr:STAS domain-containing protein [Mycobacterium sp. ELW1]QEN12130.1 STAS domain-containing protein [Mycobacterium sp. ELW1]